MSVLALDLASKTGWAVYGKDMDRPFFGTTVVKSPTQRSNGIAGERLRKLIRDQHQMHGISHIVYEAQHISAKVDPQTVYLLIGLGFMCEWIGEQIGAHVFCCDIGTWRKHFIGVGNLKRDEAKKRCIDKCNLLGWHPGDDNAADALGILDFYLSQLAKTRAALPMPWRDQGLFKGYQK